MSDNSEFQKTLESQFGILITLMKAFIDAIKLFVQTLNSFITIAIDFLGLMIDFIPYVTDGLDFFMVFIPLFLMIYIGVEVYKSIYS